jgi:8-oxo-dGTP pyrophosphatase MutT (NUDIX family)
MRLQEFGLTQKAGIIPYYYDKDGTLMMLFMTPSNPAYGGNKSQIAKGHVDKGEDIETAAFREGVEELGLVTNNIKHSQKLTSQIITGEDDTYSLTVYVAEIVDPQAFKKTDFETGSRKWLTAQQFAAAGRSNQNAIVQYAATILK